MTAPFYPLQTIRTKAAHAPVRKVWDRAFNAKGSYIQTSYHGGWLTW